MSKRTMITAGLSFVAGCSLLAMAMVVMAQGMRLPLQVAPASEWFSFATGQLQTEIAVLATVSLAWWLAFGGDKKKVRGERQLRQAELRTLPTQQVRSSQRSAE